MVLEEFCFNQNNHTSTHEMMQTLCDNHLICSVCIDSMTYAEILNNLKCLTCKSLLHTKKKDCPTKQCINCPKISKIISNCEHHDICEACLKYPDTRLKNNIGGCIKCEKFLEEHCINCLSKLNKNDQNANLKCKYNHIYCIGCLMNESLMKKPNFCQFCRDKNTDSKNNSVYSTVCTEIEYKNHDSELAKQLKTYTDQTNFCKLCKTSEENLCCGHLKCIERLKMIFLANVSNFLFQLKACSVPSDAHKKFVPFCA